MGGGLHELMPSLLLVRHSFSWEWFQARAPGPWRKERDVDVSVGGCFCWHRREGCVCPLCLPTTRGQDVQNSLIFHFQFNKEIWTSLHLITDNSKTILKSVRTCLGRNPFWVLGFFCFLSSLLFNFMIIFPTNLVALPVSGKSYVSCLQLVVKNL